MRFRVAGLLLSVATAWTSFGLYGRSISTDDGISLLAARSIAAHGYPLLPSGLIYNRAYVSHYILALSTTLFGTNDVGILVPALLAGVGTVACTIALARRVLGSDRAALLAGALVACSATQALYAASPRMYGMLSFFGVAAMLAAWRGFFEDDRRQRVLAVLAFALGLLCERGSATLLVALPFAVVSVGGFDTLRRGLGRPEGFAGLVFVASAALVAWRPAGSLRPIVVEGGNMPDFLAFSLDPDRFLYHLVHMDGLLPGTFWLALVGTVAAVRGDRNLRFAAVSCWVAFAQVALVMTEAGHRMVLFLLPLYAITVAGGVRALATSPRRAGIGAIGALILYFGLVYSEAWTGTRQHKVYAGGWLLPDQSREGDVAYAEELRAVLPRIAPDDLVLSSNPWITDYYLGRTDGMVRERLLRKGNTFTTYDEPRDEYFGALLYDETAKIDALVATLAPGQRAWLTLDFKADVFVSPAFRAHLATVFTRVNASDVVEIWVTP